MQPVCPHCTPNCEVPEQRLKKQTNLLKCALEDCKMLVLQPAGDARLTFFSLQTDCLSRAVIPTHVSLRTPASLSTKIVCVAVRYRVPTRLLLWEILSSSLTFSTWKGEEEGQHQNSLILCTSHAFDTAAHMCEMTEKHILKAVTLLPTWRTQQHASFGLRQMFVLFI